ncbi:MAG: response regulator [Desulfobacula sp.]|uniref:hybrid sensor histidine kinase/response regulator n=1 Tax=Desulfobacula sp. TaxID=2593537 RepID=UPI0025C3B002|nr:ATP-binding protein [Desulfobacula sp.]MCD4719137.1 response regulator [Desulfobacula sp.]
MPDSTTLILEKICFQVLKDCALAYFVTDNLGRITQWGGNLSGLNIPAPEKETHISDLLLFMEGILPLKSKSMEFSCIKMPSKVGVDALLFKIDNGYGLIVWDTRKKEEYLTRTQQECNELSLLIEKQKNRIIHFADKDTQGKYKNFLEDFFQALNFVVLEMNDQGHFVLIGRPPLWVEQIPQSSQILAGQAYKEDAFSFLGNFIQEAKSRWLKNHTRSFKSGIWIEKDHTDQEFLFEATAVDIHGRKLLIIAHDVCHPNEKQSIIQKGRDLALHYHNLKRSDQKLKNMHDELESRVKKRTKALEEANLKLANELKERKKVEKEREEVFRQLRQSQKIEAIGTLAGGIAHDFNNILSGIIGFTELSILEAESGSKLKQRLEKVLHASDRAKELVRQVLTFSHETSYEKRPLKLKLIVTEVLTLLRASLPSFIDIEKNLQSNSYILADHTQIHQVIMNLCTNAWQAMKEKGGTLRIELDDIDINPEDPIEKCKSISGRHLVLTIKDTGCGIPPDVIERIFDPYFTTKDKDKGTGLGLSVVHGIITKCNGCITINSQVGKGSEFQIYLPSFDAQNEAKTIEEPIPLGNNETILFIDDESFQTEAAEQLLPRLGYRVVTSNDSIKALNLFLNEKENFDLVITDMTMPKMTGKTLAKKILEIEPDIPVILCSGYSDDIHPDILKDIGIKEYLMKPIGMKDLAHAVKNALQKNE